jgi:hypothetical protein
MGLWRIFKIQTITLPIAEAGDLTCGEEPGVSDP